MKKGFNYGFGLVLGMAVAAYFCLTVRNLFK